MKKLALIVATLLLSAPAFAQTPQQPPDDKLGVAMQLLNERTGQVIELAAEVQKLTKLLKTAEAEVVKLKLPVDKK